MRAVITRRAFALALGSVAATPLLAGAPLVSERPVLRGKTRADLAPDLRQIVADANLDGDVSLAVTDLHSGRLLESRHARQTIPPASVCKAITAAYALETLGAGHRFTTRVMARGTMENGRLKGDLVLVGGGDPLLDTEALGALAKAVKATGLHEVTGRFLVYDGLFPRLRHIDAGQPDHVGYNPGLSGIALNFNRVFFEWKRNKDDYATTMEARTLNYRPQVAMARMKIVNRKGPVYDYRATAQRDEWSVARGALGRDGGRWLPVRQPGLYAGDVFATLMRSHGIVLKQAELVDKAPAGRVLAQHKSEPLSVILRRMLKYSNNLTAEMIGMAATRARGSVPRSLRRSAQEMGRWARDQLGMRNARFVDHSGLSDASRISASDMCAALRSAHRPGYRALLKAFSLRDAKGRPIKNSPTKVVAKTGTLNFVSGLAGYIRTQDGRDLVFAIFTADEPRRSKIPRRAREAPPGAKGWARRSRMLQSRLISRWAKLYAS